MGRADFSCGYTHPAYGALTAEDKVALYCFMNMRSHFYASLATFDAFRAEIAVTLSSGEPILFVDLGCGPGTSGFAPKPRKFRTALPNRCLPKSRC